MSFKLLFPITCCLLAAGCTHVKYGEFEVEAVNTVAGVSAGMSKDGEHLVLERGEQRQAIYIPGSVTEPIKVYSCQEAPLLFARIFYFGRKGAAILRVELPPKRTDLKFYRYREIGADVTFQGKKAWIMDLKEVYPSGNKLRITFEAVGMQGRKTGIYDPAANEITAVE